MFDILLELQKFIEEKTKLNVYINYIPTEKQAEESCLIRQNLTEEETQFTLCSKQIKDLPITIVFFSDTEVKSQPKYYEAHRELESSLKEFVKHVNEYQIVSADITAPQFYGIEESSNVLIYEATINLKLWY